MSRPRLLSDGEIEQIRIGIREGFRGPVMYKWLEELLGDHDARVELERRFQRTSPERVRERYGRRRSLEPDAD